MDEELKNKWQTEINKYHPMVGKVFFEALQEAGNVLGQRVQTEVRDVISTYFDENIPDDDEEIIHAISAANESTDRL